MSRPHFHVFLLLTVFSFFLGGCGGFKGVLTPTLTSINPTTVAAGSGAFTLKATGTNFVSGTTILWDGTAVPTTVTSSTQLTAKISANQILNPGVIGIRVMKPDSTTSSTVKLTITGNAFSLVSISPIVVAAGSPPFTLTAYGFGFVSGAHISLNGYLLTTSFDSATQLHARIPNTVVANPGTLTIGVTNPGNSVSNTLPLTVTGSTIGPPPTLTSLNPNTSPSGLTSPLTLTANGTNFVAGSIVYWNGVPMTTTFVSSTQLTASIPNGYFATPYIGTARVFVLNPDSLASNELQFTITVSPSLTPTLTSITNPSGTSRSQVGDPGFTLTLNGTLFAQGAIACLGNPVGVFSGSPTCVTNLPTTVASNSTTQATAQVPASALTKVAEIPVMIRNPQSHESNPIPYYVGMNIYFDEAADVVWDAHNNLLYVSKPTTSNKYPDTIMAFPILPDLAMNNTPPTATWIYQLPTGSNPDRLSLSSDGKLYVGLDGTGEVQELVITGAATKPTAGNTISLGTDPNCGAYDALDLEVSPLDSKTIAVARGIQPSATCPSEVALGGVAIYDGTTQRRLTVGPSSVPAHDAFLDNLQWSADGTKIYASNNESTRGDLYVLAVAPNGVTLSADDPLVFTIPNLFIHLDRTTGLLYGDDGLQVDPTGPSEVQMPADNGIMIPDPIPAPGTGNAYFVAHRATDTNVLEYYVETFTLASPISPGPTLDLYQVEGIPQHLIRWNDSTTGTSGLAFTTKRFNCVYSPCNVGDGRLYVIRMPF